MDKVAVAMLILVTLLVVGAVAVAGLADAVTDARQAAAERDYARAALEEARLRSDHESNAHREAMFQMWTVSLMAFGASNQWALVAVSALLGLAVGGFVVARLEQWWRGQV